MDLLNLLEQLTAASGVSGSEKQHCCGSSGTADTVL